MSTQVGILQKGIVGMNSMILLTLQIIRTFNNSPRAFSDMFKAINDPDMEPVESVQYNMLTPGYTALDNLIRNSLSEDLDQYTDVLKRMNIFFGIACLTIGLLGWIWIIQTFRKETILWFKMVRQVPWDVIVSNKLLKTYLIKNNSTAALMKLNY